MVSKGCMALYLGLMLEQNWTRGTSHGKGGIVDDEVGSSIIGSRLVRDIMRLALYMERSYPPYPKWLGTAFRELRSSAALTPLLLDTIHSATWRQRETCLLPAMELLIKQHNGLGITDKLPVETRAFWGRPFKVVWGGRIAKAIAERIEDSHLQKLAKVNPLGLLIYSAIVRI